MKKKKQKNFRKTLQATIAVLFLVLVFSPVSIDRRFIAAALLMTAGISLLFLASRSAWADSLRMHVQHLGRKPAGEDGLTDVETLLWRQICFQVTGKLKSAYPESTWDFVKRPNVNALLNGKPVRIRTFHTEQYNFAEFHLGQYGNLQLQMMTISSLEAGRKGSREAAPAEGQQADPESWYSLIGKPLLMELVSDLQARGHQKLLINEAGEILVQNGSTLEPQATFDYFPPKGYWPALTDIFLRDELQAAETEQGLELSWT